MAMLAFTVQEMHCRDILEPDWIASQLHRVLLYVQCFSALGTQVRSAGCALLHFCWDINAFLAKHCHALRTYFGFFILFTQTGTARFWLWLWLWLNERWGCRGRRHIGNHFFLALHFHRFRSHSRLIIIILLFEFSRDILNLKLLFVGVSIVEAQRADI